MVTSLASANSLAQAIRTLLALKSDRDNVNFTAYKLAKEIQVDRSLIQRILSGEVENPRIDTLMKIINFFSGAGFEVTLDDLLNWKKNIIDVQEQVLSEGTPQKLSLYQMENFNGEPVAVTTVIIPKASPGMIAVLSSRDIKPIFTPGSIFIVDMLKQPIHDNLIVIRSNSGNQIFLRKWIVKHKKKFLYNYDDDSTQPMDKMVNAKIIGVVIRVNIKT